MKNKILLAILFAAIPFRALADTPPIIDIFKLKAEGQTGIINAASGVVGKIAPGASGNVMKSTGSAWSSQAPGFEPSLPSGSSAQYLGGDKLLHTLDTLAVPENGNLYWTTARFNAAFGGKSTTDLVEGSNLYWTTARFDSAFGGKSTSNLSEGSNLYFTNARVDSEFDARLALKSTSNLAEGTNLYWTPARFNAAFGAKSTTDLVEGTNLYYTAARFSAALAGKSTSDLAEGSNLYYTNGRVDTEFDTRLATKSTSNLAEGSNLYYTQGRFDSAFSGKTTTNLAEGTNLYWTPARFNTQLATKSTSDLAEGSNLYYTNGRVDTEFDTRLATKSTTNLSEGSNLYYTDTRVQTAAKNGVSAQILYVSKDVGNDAFDGSLIHPYKTIGAAVIAANALAAYYKQVDIHVEPSNGTSASAYLENVTLSQQGVNLICDDAGAFSRACIVTGTLTVNLTGTSGGTNFIAASNEVKVKGMTFVSGSSTAVTFSGTAFQRLIAEACYFQASAAHAAVITNSGTSSGTPSEFRSYDTTFENNSASLETVTLTAGRFWFYGTTGTVQNNNAAGLSVVQNGGSSAIYNLVQLTGEYSLSDNTATATFNLSTITSGANPCIVTPSSPSTGYALLSYFGCNSSATNSITGSGIVVNSPSNVRFGTSGDIISTVTQSVLGTGFPQGETLLGAGATAGTNVLLSILNGHVKVSQTTAATASPSANAGTSATCTLTNGRDSSGIINLTEGSGSWASGTQCTVTFNKAYGVAPNCVISPHNAAAASHQVTQQFFSTTTTTTLVLATGVADSAATASQWSYKCEEP